MEISKNEHVKHEFDLANDKSEMILSNLIQFLGTFVINNPNENKILKKITSFTHDNYAWMFAFFDWYAELDESKIATHETFTPLTVADNSTFDPNTIALINEWYESAPLVIGENKDTLNEILKSIITFISKIKTPEHWKVISHIFKNYFPRVGDFFLKKTGVLNLTIDKKNLGHVKSIDGLFREIILKRYIDLHKYTEQIIIMAIKNNDDYINSSWPDTMRDAIEKKRKELEQMKDEDTMETVYKDISFAVPSTSLETNANWLQNTHQNDYLSTLADEFKTFGDSTNKSSNSKRKNSND